MVSFALPFLSTYVIVWLLRNWWKIEQQISRIESKKSNLSWPTILKTISRDAKILRCITKFPAVTPTYVVFDSWLFVGIHYYEWRNFNFSGYKINMYHARKNCLFCIFWIFAYFHTLHIFLLTLMIKQRQTDRSWGQLPILKFSFSEKPTKNLRNRPHGFEVY